jgi:hypothetical protein
MTYSQIYECDRVVLLYPHHHELKRFQLLLNRRGFP